jgi:hypothetical protein
METTPEEQQSLTGQITPQMRTITYNDEAVPWSRSSHLTGARVLPSSDDSDSSESNFSPTRPELR